MAKKPISAEPEPKPPAEAPVETTPGQAMQQPTKFRQPTPDEAMKGGSGDAAIRGPKSE